MPKFYKYRSFDHRGTTKEKQFTNNIILNSALYFSPIEGFNDPFDCKLSYRQKYSKKEIRNYFIQFRSRNPSYARLKDLLKELGSNQAFIEHQNHSTKELIKKIGVLSLSTNPNSILMWSHYSLNHTGLVFEFSTSDKSICFDTYYKIDYSENYELLSYAEENKTEIPKLMLTKHKDWEYESEFRIIDMHYQGEKKFDKKELTSIIFGALAKENDMIRMINLCKNNGFNHVKFSHAELSTGEFSLKFRELIIDE